MHLLTQSALLKALGWSLFNSLWQMGLCWLFYRLFIIVFRNASSHVRHNLAVLLLGIGATGSVIQFIASYFFPGAPAGIGSLPGFGATTGAVSRLYINEALPWCSSLYLVVLAVLLVRYSNNYFYSRRLKYTGLSKMQPELRLFTETMSRRMGIRRPVQAWLSSLVDVPLTLGFIKPVILLPVAMANNLTLEQTETILLHELAHIRRNDYLLNLGVAALELLFFFNPFSRLLINEVKREREHRCDDWVMQFRYDPHTYVSALLSLATHSPQRPLLTLAATGSGNDRLLLQRARRILRQKDASSRSAKSLGDRPNARPVILLLFTLAMTLAGERSQKPLSTQEQASHTATTIRITEFNEVWAAQRPPARIRVINITLPPISPAPKVRDAIAHITPRKPRPAVTARIADPNQFMDEEEGDNDIVMAGADANAPGTETYATIIQPDNREYSIGSGPSITPIPSPGSQKIKNENLPFVPQSSFSIQYMEDSSRPAQQAEQLAYWQLSTQREIAMALNKLQQDLAAQWRALQQKQAAKPQANQATLQQFRSEQLKLQQQYLQKLDALQKKLEKANRRLRIVYI